MSIGAIIDPFIPASMPVPVVPLLTYTIFPDVSPTRKIQREDVPWSELTSKIQNAPAYPEKRACPLISIAEYADEIPKGYKSIRCAENVRRIFGVEVDYDGEKLSIGEAADKIVAVNLCSILYTSPSHTRAKPRWRALFPLSEPAAPDKRVEYVARANRVLGGIASRESFVLSQSFYIGRVAGVEYEVQETQGRCIDLAVDIEPQYFNGAVLELVRDITTDAQLRESFERGDNRYQSMLKLSSRWAARGLGVDDIESNLLELLGTGSVNGDGIDLRTRVRPMAESAFRKFGETRQAVGSESPARAVQANAPSVWPEPTPLPEGLPPVSAFEYDLLPPVLHRRVEDIAERMQCPPDFPAVATIVTLSSLIGRRCGIAPKRADDWTVVPNLWGMVVGRPGIMKSPALAEVMKPLQVLQAHAIREFDGERTAFEARSMVAVEAERVAKEEIRKLLKNNQGAYAAERAEQAVSADMAEPACRRYIVNDSTVEKLGEILNENPYGLCLFRDELAGFFRTLERQGHESDRAFYLECWNGDNSFTYDRIGRGTLHIEGACIAVLGGIQPGPLSSLVRELRGGGDDGLLQRFQLAVWPDATPEWRNVDRAPDAAGREAISTLIDRLDRATAMSLGADPGAIPILRFGNDAQELFDAWRATLEVRLRNDSEHPSIEGHLSKYRSMVPSLALILHLAEVQAGPVSLIALERAIAWADYLETHARRIYAPAIRPDMDAARMLARRVKAGELGDSFSLRDVYNKGWSGLATREEVVAGTSVLAEYDWLREFEESTPGRKRTRYVVNPNVTHKEASL